MRRKGFGEQTITVYEGVLPEGGGTPPVAVAPGRQKRPRRKSPRSMSAKQQAAKIALTKAAKFCKVEQKNFTGSKHPYRACVRQWFLEKKTQ